VIRVRRVFAVFSQRVGTCVDGPIAGWLIDVTILFRVYGGRGVGDLVARLVAIVLKGVPQAEPVVNLVDGGLALVPARVGSQG